jgi:hypothetical protein
MSGITKGFDTQNLLGVVAGSVLAGYLNKLLPATLNDKVIAGSKVALGIALPKFVKGSLMAGIGSGMVAVGSVDLLKSFGALSGDFDIPTINGDILAGDILAGDDDLPVINGDDDLPTINADLFDDMGEDEMGEDDDTMGEDFITD